MIEEVSMKVIRFIELQILSILRQAEGGVPGRSYAANMA